MDYEIDTYDRKDKYDMFKIEYLFKVFKSMHINKFLNNKVSISFSKYAVDE